MFPPCPKWRLCYPKCYMGDTGLLDSLAFMNSPYIANELYKTVFLDKLNINEGRLTELDQFRKKFSKGIGASYILYTKSTCLFIWQYFCKKLRHCKVYPFRHLRRDSISLSFANKQLQDFCSYKKNTVCEH